MQEDTTRFSIDEFVSVVKNNSSFILTTHVNPDGDALGSEIGLAEWLTSLGKHVRVLNHSKTPENYYFLDPENSIVEVYEESKHKDVIDSADVLMLLDTNDPERSRSLEGYFSTHKNKVLIDHHLYPKTFADHEFLDTNATSTGEMIFRLVTAAQKSLGGVISAKAAQALYAAIMTDTGSFRFPRTVSDTFRMSAELIDLGADPVYIYDRIYNTSKSSRVLLIGRCLSSLRFHYDDKVAIQYILQKDLAECNAIEEEVDGFVQFPLQVESVVFSVFLLELKSGWKISFRSKGVYSAAGFAQQFGGNGHFNAAGARVAEKLTLQEMLDKLVATAEQFMNP
jgi:bifunctional oligoribonuclease and PAP phosphatase NrnA